MVLSCRSEAFVLARDTIRAGLNAFEALGLSGVDPATYMFKYTYSDDSSVSRTHCMFVL